MDEVVAAENAADNGQPDEAREKLKALRKRAPNQELERIVIFDLAELARESGDEAGATLLYTELYEADVEDEPGARAMYAVAESRRGANPDGATAMKVELVRKFPNTAFAETALADVVRAYAAPPKHSALDDLLEEFSKELKEALIADNVLFELADLRDNKRDDPNGALDALRRLYAGYPDEALADDALWEMSRIYARHQMWAPTIALLKRITDDVEESWFVGDYNSVWLDNALYELGLIHLLRIADYDAAVSYFERYIQEFPDHLLVDDAAWNIVEAHRLAGDEGARVKAARLFVGAYPESRFVERAEQVASGGGR